MAVPSRVPITNTAPLADNEPQPTGTRSVAAVLAERKTSPIADWLTRTKKTPKLNHLRLSDEEPTGHLSRLVEGLIERLGRPKLPDRDSDAIVSRPPSSMASCDGLRAILPACSSMNHESFK
jgi:hypothetical protein